MKLRRCQSVSYRHSEELTIRWATPGDSPGLQDLAELDEASLPAAPVLLGLVGNQLWAAVSLSSREVIADPFKPSAEVLDLVIERGRQLTVTQPGVRGQRGRWIADPRRRSFYGKTPRPQGARGL